MKLTSWRVISTDPEMDNMILEYDMPSGPIQVGTPMPRVGESIEAIAEDYHPEDLAGLAAKPLAEVAVGTSGVAVERNSDLEETGQTFDHIAAAWENVLRDLPTVPRKTVREVCDFDLNWALLVPVYHNVTRCVGVEVKSPEEAVGAVATLRDLGRAIEHAKAAGIPVVGFDMSPEQIHSAYAEKYHGAELNHITDGLSISIVRT